MRDEAELLRRYAADQSEAAFTELVHRHADLVYSAVFRLVGGDGHRAQDVTQQVFTELARQAARLTTHPALAGWLYTTARRMAAHNTRTEQRRHAREQEAHLMNELLRDAGPEADWEEVGPVLEEAMHGLGELDRLAVLLRFFENRSLREVGTALGLSETAARKRVDRALDRLRLQLARRGVTSTATALALTLTSHAVTAAPPAFVATLAGASLAGVAAGAGTTLTIMKVMAMTKLQAGIAGALILAGTATSLVVLHQSHTRQRAMGAALQRQTRQLARLQAENERLSNRLAQARRPPVNSRNDLQRLRREVASLRQQTNQLAALQAEERRLERRGTNLLHPPTKAVIEARKALLKYAMHLDNGLFDYAANHHGQFPTNFNQAASFIAAELRGQTNLTRTQLQAFSPSQFQIVYRGSRDALSKYAHPGNILLFRMRQPWHAPDGSLEKAYIFADGHGQILNEPPGGFGAWENRYIVHPVASPP